MWKYQLVIVAPCMGVVCGTDYIFDSDLDAIAFAEELEEDILSDYGFDDDHQVDIEEVLV